MGMYKQQSQGSPSPWGPQHIRVLSPYGGTAISHGQNLLPRELKSGVGEIPETHTTCSLYSCFIAEYCVFVLCPGFHQSSTAHEPYFLAALSDPLLLFLSHKVIHYDVWNYASIFQKYLPFTFSAIVFPQYLLHLPTFLKPDCALWTLLLQGKFLCYGFYVLLPCTSCPLPFQRHLLLRFLKNKILPFEIRQSTIHPIPIIVSYRIFHTQCFIKMWPLFQFYTMGLADSSITFFFPLTPIISTHLHRHTLDQIVTSILIQLLCSQKPSRLPDWLVQLHPPPSAFTNLSKHLQFLDSFFCIPG